MEEFQYLNEGPRLEAERFLLCNICDIPIIEDIDGVRPGRINLDGKSYECYEYMKSLLCSLNIYLERLVQVSMDRVSLSVIKVACSRCSNHLGYMHTAPWNNQVSIIFISDRLFKVQIDAKMEAYFTFARLFVETHIDNMTILGALTEDQLPLIDGSTKQAVDLDVLRGKNLLLLISDLDISQEELSALEHMYKESRHQPTRSASQYEVVWLPVLDRLLPFTEQRQRRLESKQKVMPCYSLKYPQFLKPAVSEYFRKVWHFEKQPISVVLDAQGRVAFVATNVSEGLTFVNSRGDREGSMGTSNIDDKKL